MLARCILNLLFLDSDLHCDTTGTATDRRTRAELELGVRKAAAFRIDSCG
jgi:hypothetical protein